jgi:hypothetical protein
MWQYVTTILFTYFIYDLFYIEHEKGKGTDAQQIRKLYKNIVQLNNTKYPNKFTITRKILAAKDTFITIMKFKSLRFANKIFTFERLGKNYIGVPYYMNNTWYRIPIPHNMKNTNIVLNVKNNNKDVTKRVKQYLGPNEDFHQQQLSSLDLGYPELTFEILSPCYEKYKVTFVGGEKIIFKKPF